MVVGLLFTLLVSLLLSAVVSALLPVGALAVSALQELGVACITIVVFTLTLKTVPDAELSWSDVAVGGVLTGIAFSIGKVAMGTYLGQSAIASAYGAAGSLVLLLLWVFYSSMIFFVGAEVTSAWAQLLGEGIEAADVGRITDPASAAHPETPT
jgi:membrane protein